MSNRHLEITGSKARAINVCQRCPRVSDLTGVPATPPVGPSGADDNSLPFFLHKTVMGTASFPLSNVSPLPALRPPLRPQLKSWSFFLISTSGLPCLPSDLKLTSGSTPPPPSPPAKACGPVTPPRLSAGIQDLPGCGLPTTPCRRSCLALARAPEPLPRTRTPKPGPKASVLGPLLQGQHFPRGAAVRGHACRPGRELLTGERRVWLSACSGSGQSLAQP